MAFVDLTPAFFNNVDNILEEQNEPIIISIDDLRLFLPLYLKEFRKGYDDELLGNIAKKYLKISKNSKRILIYKVNEYSENDIVLYPLFKNDIEIGDGFKYALLQIKRHGHDPAFSKISNMKNLETMMTKSIIVTNKKSKKDDDSLSDIIGDF